MTFGLKNSTQSFQQHIDSVLRNCEDFANAYSILIVFFNFFEGCCSAPRAHVKVILEALGKASYKIYDGDIWNWTSGSWYNKK